MPLLHSYSVRLLSSAPSTPPPTHPTTHFALLPPSLIIISYPQPLTLFQSLDIPPNSLLSLAPLFSLHYPVPITPNCQNISPQSFSIPPQTYQNPSTTFFLFVPSFHPFHPFHPFRPFVHSSIRPFILRHTTLLWIPHQPITSPWTSRCSKTTSRRSHSSDPHQHPPHRPHSTRTHGPPLGSG